MEDSHRLNNFVKDGSDRSVQDIVSRLKFISKIKEGELDDALEYIDKISKNSQSYPSALYVKAEILCLKNDPAGSSQGPVATCNDQIYLSTLH